MTRYRRAGCGGVRALSAAVLLALVAVLVAPASAAVGVRRAGTHEGTFQAPGGPELAYLLFVPSRAAGRGAGRPPLLVYLHGCNQTAADAAVGARLQQLAAKEGVLVLLPQQTRSPGSSYPVSDGNSSGCWNWFHADHQARGKGEPVTIAGLTRDVARRYAADPARIWVGGISAGGAMTAVMSAAYPDVYAAAVPIAGCAYRTCSDLTGTAAYAAMGLHARPVPTLVIQASADVVSNVAMGGLSVVRQTVSTNDLADDGRDNGSVPDAPTARRDQAAEPGTAPGDPCVGQSRLPCAGGVLGLRSYPYTMLEFGPTVTAMLIHGANHAFTGGDPRGSFVDPVGPDMTYAMYDFFRAQAVR